MRPEGRWEAYLGRRDALRLKGETPIGARRLLLDGEFAPLNSDNGSGCASDYAAADDYDSKAFMYEPKTEGLFWIKEVLRNEVVMWIRHESVSNRDVYDFLMSWAEDYERFMEICDEYRPLD